MDHYSKQNKPRFERQNSHFLSHIKSRIGFFLKKDKTKTGLFGKIKRTRKREEKKCK